MDSHVQLDEADILKGKIYAKVFDIDNVFRLRQIDKFIDNINR